MMVGDGDVANAEFARPLEMVFDLGCGVIAPLAVQVQVVLCLRLLRAIHEIGPPMGGVSAVLLQTYASYLSRDSCLFIDRYGTYVFVACVLNWTMGYMYFSMREVDKVRVHSGGC